MRRTALLSLLTALALALGMLSPGTAVPVPVYKVTKVTSPGQLQLNFGGATSCTWREQADLMMFAKSRVAEPIWAGQVSVEGLQIGLYRGTRLMATLPISSQYLEPGATDLSGSFLTVSCKDWRPLMKSGFGGPNVKYNVLLVGKGRAYDTNEGDYVGIVRGKTTPSEVTIRQMGIVDRASSTKSGSTVTVKTRLRTWARKDGKFRWVAKRDKSVTLRQAGGDFRFRDVTTVRTNRNGWATFRIPARAKTSYLQFKVGGLNYNNEQTYELSRTGQLTALINR